MNHIYKTVWNAAMGTWTAVQETAKSHGKSSSGKADRAGEQTVSVRFAFTLMASALLLASGQVMAVTGTDSAGKQVCFYDAASQSVVCGDATTQTDDMPGGKTAKSVVIGQGASNAGESNVAVGIRSSSAETASVAIGSEAKALHNQSVAIGQNAEAHADWDISIGRFAGQGTKNPEAEGRNIAIGDGALRNATNPNNNVALGTSAAAGSAGDFNVVIGTYANSTTAQASGVRANRVVAIGDRALATADSAIAIGNRVKASGSIATAVGASADAKGAYSIANGYAATAEGVSSIAIGAAQNLPNKTQATKNYAIALGSVGTQATGEAAIAIGTEAKASNRDATAIGKAANAAGQDGVAIGLNANAAGQGVVAMGTRAGTAALPGNLPAGAAVVAPTDAVFIGSSAGHGSNNNRMQISIGNNAGKDVGNKSTVATTENIAIGNTAGSGVNGNTNVAISSRAGQNVEGHDNFAALLEAGQNLKGVNNIAIGKQAGRSADPSAPLEVSNTIAMGLTAQGTHNDTIALGRNAKAQIEDSIAIGRGVTTELLQGDAVGSREGMIAIGSERTKASGKAAVAIGRNSQGIGRGTVALGDDAQSTTGQAIAVGAGVRSGGAGSVAIGSASKSNADRAVSLGVESNSTAYRSVALGAQSEAARAALTPNAATSNAATAAGNQVYALDQATQTDKDAISATVKGSLGAVSVGNATNTRQIINVAAGSEDSDAVNVAQLKAVANQINQAAGTHYYSVKDQAGDAASANSNYNNDGATGDRSLAAGIHSKATGTNATAVGGKHAKATAVQALALGADTLASGNSSIAIGGDDLDHLKQSSLDYYNTLTGDTITVGQYQDTTANADAAIAVGVQTQATGDLSTAVGVKSEASGLASVALGVGAKGQAEGGVALGAGAVVERDAKTAVALGSKAVASVNTAMALGTLAQADKEWGVALGALSSTASNATQETTATVGGITYSGFAGAGSVDAGRQVSVGRAGLERQIKNVAPGAINATSTDAINGSQLFATQTVIDKLASSTARNFGGGAAVQPDGSISAPTYTINGATYSDVGAALQAAANSGGGAGAGTHYYSVKSTDTAATSNFNNDGAKVVDSVAAGVRVEALRRNGVVMGVDAVASGSESLALGNNVIAGALQAKASPTDPDVVDPSVDVTGATAVGNNSRATAVGAQAFGQSSKATAENAAAVGRLATASGRRASAFGVGNTASGESSFSGGDRTVAAGKGAVAVGAWGNATDPLGNKATRADAPYAVVVGAAAQANQHSDSAVVIGNQASATGASANSTAKDSVAIGYRSAVTTASNIALGSNAKADGNSQATAIGNMANAKGYQSIAFGSNASAAQTAGGSVALGRETKTTAGNAVAIGNTSQANVSDSVALGSGAATLRGTNPSAPSGSVAIGRGAQTTDRGYALGINARATNESIAIGTNANYDGTASSAKTIGLSSVAIGNNTNAAGENTVALGNQSTATGSKATALGFDTKAQGQSSVVIGDSARNERATGNASYPDADQAVVVGVSSNVNSLGGIAIGSTTKTTGVYGTAVGIGSVNNADFGVALGALSTTDSNIVVNRDGYDPLNPTGTADAAILATKANAAGVSVGGKVLSTQGSAPGQTAVRPNGVSDGDIIRRQVHNVAAGTDDTDAVNVAQLKAAGFKLTTSQSGGTVTGTSVEKVKNGDVFTLDAGDGIALDQAGSKITISTNLPIAYTQADGSKVYKHSNGKFYDKPEGQTGAVEVPTANVIASMQNADGSTTAPTTLANVKAGVNDNDAVNVAQLNAAKTHFYSVNSSDATAGNYNNDGATGIDALAAGVGASAKQNYSVAVGTGAKTIGDPTSGSESIAIGRDASAAGDASLAIGPRATVTSDDGTSPNGIAIGAAATAKNGGMAVGSGADSGNGTELIPGTPMRLNNNVALGDSARVKDDTNFRVALGSMSIAGESDLSVAPYKPTIGSNVAGVAAPDVQLGEVSVGGDNTAPGHFGKKLYRRVTNVAAGSADTDAVNVSQLKAVAKASATHYYSVNSTEQGAGSNYDNDGATGSNALAAGRKAKAAGANSVAVGNEASAGHNLSVAIGHAAQTRGKHALAIGAKAKAGTEGSPAGADAGSWGTAIGYNAEASGTGSPLAIGTESKTVGGESPIAIGDWATVEGTGAIAIGGKAGGGHVPGRSTYAKGVRTVALGYLAQATEQDALALGANANASLSNAVALGAGSLTSTNATQETQASVGNITYGAAVGALGAFAGAANVEAGDQVSVGSAGSERQIKHVAPGRIAADSTDAINGSQLHATQTVIGNVADTTAAHLGGGAAVGADGKISAPTYNVTNAAGNTVGTAASNVGAALANLNNYVNSGFDVQGNGTTQGTVSPTEKINFVNGVGTTAVVSSEANGITNITFDVNAQGLAESAQLPVVYTKADGSKVYKHSNGNFYDKPEGDPAAQQLDPANIIASMQNPDGSTTTATTLANVKAGVNATDAVNVSQLQGAAAALGGGAGVNADGTFKAPSYTISKTDGTSYAAVDNVGAALGNLNAEVVKPLTITGNTNSDTGSDGSQQTLGSTLAISGGLADASKTSSNSNIRTVITDNKVDIQLADAPTFTGTVTAPIFVAHGAQNRITIDGNTGNISGLSRNLPKTQSENTAGPGNPSNITTAQALPAGVDALASNAATVGDVLNAGWNLQGNSTAKDFVRAYDTVNFVNGNGTTVEVDSDGATSTIKVNVNAQGLAEAAQLPVVYTKADGSKVYKHSDGKFYDKPEGDNTAQVIAVGDVIASMQNADGSTTAPTTLANIKAGVNDNDAVNMAQLKAVEAAANAAKTHYYSVNSTVTGANSNYNNDGATGANALAAGVGASATGISATAVGHGATAGAEFAVAVGLDAQATASGAMAFGNGAQATGQDSLAHGKASKATSNFATAVGNAASAGLHATAVGNGAAASGNYATSFGTGSAATGGGAAALGNDAKASEWAAVAVGRDAQATQTGAVAIGESARAAHEHSVALGSGSATAAVDNTGRASATVGGITYSGFAADAPTSMVSVGRAAGHDAAGAPIPAINRTITNVAAGRIAADSTDAINGSQLHATQTVIGNVAGSVKNILGGDAAVGNDGKLSMTNIGGTGKGTIHEAIEAINTTAGAGWGIGNGGTTPVGTVKPGKQVDFVAGNGSTKVDVAHDASSGNSKVTVSAAPGALQYTGTNNADGSNTPNADQFTPTNQVTLVGAAGNANGVTINNVAPAELSATSKQAVNGSQLHAVGSSTAAALGGTSAFDPATGNVTAGLSVGGTTHTSVQDALNAINTTAGAGWNLQANGGTPSNVVPNGTVNVVDGSNTKVTLTGNTLKVDVVDAPTFSGQVTANGGLTVGGNLTAAAGTNVSMGGNVIHDVADGVADTDAVNVRQLRSVSGNITNITNQINAVDARVTQVDNRVTNVDNRVTQVDARVTNVDNRVTEVDNRVTNVDNRVADLTGRVDGIDTRVTDVTNLVGPNLTNPDGTKGLTVYDVAGQTRTDHTNVISALNQVKNEGTKYSHTRDNGEAPIIGPTNDSSAGALGSTAQGVNAIVEPDAENATAMGRRARVRNAAARSVAIGNEAVTGGASAVAVGDGAQALGEKSISIGTGNVVEAARSGAIGDPTTIIATATDSYSIGNNNTVNTADTFVMGNNVVSNVANSVYLGAGAAATAAPTAQSAGMATYNASVVDGVTHHYAGGTPAGVVSVGDVGQERRVQNVAAGLVSPTSTDAINGSQLYQTNAAIGGLNNRINANHDKAMGGIASAMASAGLPQAYLPGKSMIAMGVGAYQGRSAVAVGVSTISDNGRWIIKGSVNANNKGHVGATLGAGYQW